MFVTEMSSALCQKSKGRALCTCYCFKCNLISAL